MVTITMVMVMVTIIMVMVNLMIVVQRLRLSSEDQDLSSLKLSPNMRVCLEWVSLRKILLCSDYDDDEKEERVG